jgi:Fic family protein
LAHVLTTNWSAKNLILFGDPNQLEQHNPYTKIAFVMEELGVSRITATRYLNELEKMGLLEKETIWKDHYYINKRLFTLLSNVNM